MTDPDLSNDKLFMLWARVAERGDPDPGGGTAYALDTACPACGTGAKQISPLRLKRRDLPTGKPIAQTFRCWKLLHDSVVRVLKKEFDVAKDLTPVEDAKTGARLPFWQLRPMFVMPPMAPETKGMQIEGQCPTCRRDGHYGSDLEPAYRLDAATLAALPPLSQTWECFGLSIREDRQVLMDGIMRGQLAGFAVPKMLARGDVCAALRRCIPRPQMLTFEPVLLLRGKPVK
jgi:hypothetical protein